MKCYEEISVKDYLNLKKKMIEFSIRDLEEISLFLINTHGCIEWGLHEKTQSFNIGFWSKLEGIHQLFDRPVRTSTYTTITTTPSPQLLKILTQYEYKMSIFKTYDDWFLVEIFFRDLNIGKSDEGFWIKIDQIDGLLEFLERLFQVCLPFDFKRCSGRYRSLIYQRSESILDEIISKNTENDNNGYLSYMWLPVADPGSYRIFDIFNL